MSYMQIGDPAVRISAVKQAPSEPVIPAEVKRYDSPLICSRTSFSFVLLSSMKLY